MAAPDTAPSRNSRHFGKLETRARQAVLVAFGRTRRQLDKPLTRPLLLAVSRAAAALQYGRACHVSWKDGVWEYHWPGAVVLSDQMLVAGMRPEQFGKSRHSGPRDGFFWDYLPGPGDVVVDVGAGIGTEMYQLTELVGAEGRIYAFEPHPKVFGILKRACEANRWTNVEPVQAAIADKTGTVSITDNPEHVSNDILHAGGQEVASYTLDEFVASHGIDRVDWLKMNIEGAELLAIQGIDASAPLIKHMTISCHDFTGEPDKRTKEPVRDWLIRNGFTVRENVESPFPWLRDFLYASR